MSKLEISNNNGEIILTVSGRWTLSEFGSCRESGEMALNKLKNISSDNLRIDGKTLEKLDTAGSEIIISLMRKVLTADSRIILDNFSEEQKNLFELVHDRLEKFELTKKEKTEKKSTLMQLLAKFGFNSSHYLNELFGFLGLISVSLVELIKNPRLFRPKEIVSQLEEACIKSVPVVALVTFLIGVVVAYLMALQLEKYGGNIFVVNGVALAMCREMSPVIVALVMAGRSGSAYTAQIGAMKLNEEVDAITTLGLSVQHVLVLPRVIALIISMPLLVFIGDLVGIFGGMIVADSFLGISYSTFIERLKVALPPKHFITGMIKAPVFAAVIAMIGCRRGLAAEMNARSVGLSTTATVVESIVLVIILNALFAVIFAQMGV